MSATARERRSKGERVARALEKRIRDGRLRPGQHLGELDLVREFKVSRTPIRYALATLHSRGFITLFPNRGAVVNHLSTRDLEDIYTVVAALEGVAAELAVPRVTSADLGEMERLNQLLQTPEYLTSPDRYLDADVRFHRTYLMRCPNDRLRRLIRHQLAVVHRYRILSHSIQERLVNSLGEHAAIVRAFRAGDAVEVRHRVEQHILHGGRLLKEYVQRYGLL